MLNIQGLNQFYGGSHILWDVTLAVPTGSCTCLMGRNGGKGALKSDGDIARGAERFAEEIDQVRQFADQCLMPAPDQRTEQKAVYSAYKFWAANNGMGVLKAPEVSARLTAIGYAFKKIRGSRYHVGCFVVDAPDQAAITEPVEDFFHDNVS